MDEAEYGSACAETFFKADLHNHRLRAAVMETGGSSRERCEDCGELIPAERRESMEKMGMICTRCVMCKAKLERGGR